MWRSRRWRDLLTLIDWLPRNSAYLESMADDEEVAEQILDQAGKSKSKAPRPRISEWSAELEKLTDMVDRLGEVMQAVVAAAGGKPPKVRPQPRPRTAADRLREKRRLEHHKKVVSRVLIRRPDGSVAPLSSRPTSQPTARPAAGPRPVISPGENPFRLKSGRRSKPAGPDQQVG